MFDQGRALSTVLLFGALAGTARANLEPRLKCFWEEKNARVVVFSPDGRNLVSSGAQGGCLRDAETGTVRAVLTTEPDELYGPVFSPDGRLLFAKVRSDRYQPVGVFDLKVWDVATGKEKATIPYISEAPNAVTDDFALSHDGKTLAFLDHCDRLPMKVEAFKESFEGREYTVHLNRSKGLPRVTIWDVSKWKERLRLEGGSPPVFSPDGELLITGARDWHDPTAMLWETATGRKRTQFDSGSPWMKPLAFSPNGKLLAIGAFQKQELYELASGRRWPVETPGSRFEFPVFSPDGRLLFPDGLPHMGPNVQERTVGYSCYDLGKLPPRRIDLEPGELVISPDGRRYAVVHGKRSPGELLTVTLRDLPSLRETGHIVMTGLDGATFTPNGRWLALMTGRYETLPALAEIQHTQEIQFLDPSTARVDGMIPSRGPLWGNLGWKFSGDGRYLVLSYCPGSNVAQPGEANPFDRPARLEIWEIEPR